MKIGWSTDFIVVDGERPAIEQLKRVDAATAQWVVIVRSGLHRYVFSCAEVFERLRRTAVPYDPASKRSLAEVLDLHETQASTGTTDRSQAAPPDLSWRPNETTPSVRRHVELDRAGKVLAVGGADVERQRTTRSARPRIGAARPQMAEPPAAEPPTAGSAAPEEAGPADAAAAAPAGDEGTTPIRFPSIEPDGAVRAGAPVTLIVDLLREEAAHTVGGIALPAQPADWQTIELGVLLDSPAIDFDDGGAGKVTIRRNDSSLAARIAGRVHADVTAGSEIEVKARFLNGTRFSGSALRKLRVAGAEAGAGSAVASGSQGAVQVDAAAEPPDLLVFITLFDRARPGLLHWQMVTRAFDKLPPKLKGMADLGRDPAAEAALLFKQFANLERGKHRESIEGFGEELWRRAPAEFQAAYWAVCDHYRRPLTIQFVSDDPHLPWELMSPFRDGEAHGPMLLRHAVARWIGDWQGYMRNRLPAGRLLVIAPHYKSASTQLSLAEAAAQRLVDKLDARRIGGTRQALLDLLEQPPAEPVALLYFTGHGAFNADAAAASLIKLEDANVGSREVARQKVMLGERHGSVVFFNACEVGATASVLGTVGGWADAFLSRRFRAFIAPLWAIDEEDAAQVTQELMTKIVTERAPLGAALRDLRAAHGGVSPTFFSYLLYGDVTARLDE